MSPISTCAFTRAPMHLRMITIVLQYKPYESLGGLKVRISPAAASQAMGSQVLQSAVASDARTLLDIQLKLSSLGAADVLEVPKLVFCGDQSAGKSSILQRICGIELPRSDGTCTRCPMEVHLRQTDQGEAWTCKIHLRMAVGLSAKVVPFGEEVTDKAKVLDLVKRAQAAILNPDEDASQFLPETPLPATNALKFTKDVVVLEISDPGGFNLTLVDLPGIIHTQRDPEDQKYVDLVKEMTMEQISKPETVIVAAFSCKSEMESQALFAMAREVDPRGERTVGVLTKADTIEPGTHKKYFDYLSGNEYRLKLGYFMLRNPPQLELDEGCVSPKVAQDREDEFFQTVEPFKSKMVWLQNHAGLKQLQPQLSALLVSRLSENLPKLKETALRLLRQDQKELESLPQHMSPSQLARWLRKELDLFQSGLRQLSELAQTPRAEDVETLDRTIRRADQTLIQDLLDARPRFLLSKAQPLAIGSQDVYAQYPGCAAGEQGQGPEITLEKLEEMIESNLGTGLFMGVPYPAIREAVRNSHADWLSKAEAYLDTVYQCLETLVLDRLKGRFEQYTRLHTFLRACVLDLLHSTREATAALVRRAVLDEQGGHEADKWGDGQDGEDDDADEQPPSTAQHNTYVNTVHKTSTHIKASLARVQLGLSPDQDLTSDLTNMLAYAGRLRNLFSAKTADEVLGRLLVLEGQKEHAVLLMAMVMVYYQMSSVRLVDTVPRLVKQCLIMAVKRTTAHRVRTRLAGLQTAEQTLAVGPSKSKGKSKGTGGNPAKLDDDREWFDNPAVQQLVTEDRSVKDTWQRRAELEPRIEMLKAALAALNTV